jgi:hypothetical protein
MRVRRYIVNIQSNSHVYFEKTQQPGAFKFACLSRVERSRGHSFFEIKIELSRGYATYVTCTAKIRHQPIRLHRAYMRLRFLDDQDYQLASQLVPPLSLLQVQSYLDSFDMVTATFAKK